GGGGGATCAPPAVRRPPAPRLPPAAPLLPAAPWAGGALLPPGPGSTAPAGANVCAGAAAGVVAARVGCGAGAGVAAVCVSFGAGAGLPGLARCWVTACLPAAGGAAAACRGPAEREDTPKPTTTNSPRPPDPPSQRPPGRSA